MTHNWKKEPTVPTDPEPFWRCLNCGGMCVQDNRGMLYRTEDDPNWRRRRYPCKKTKSAGGPDAE